MAWISAELKNIYYGQQCSPDDIEIPDAPGQFYNWDGSAWVHNAEAEALQARELAKQARQAAVDSITVTVNGKVFDGDETSQTRMARAIIGLQATRQATIKWTLADNTETQATLAELTEALCLAGDRQGELWAI